MSSNSLFSQKMISIIKKTHKVFLWVATGILIASLMLGAILIFVDTKNDMFGKIQATFFILALVAFVSVNNFIRIEKGGKLIQGFASAGFLANIVWLVLGILMIWGVCSPVQVDTPTMKSNNVSTNTYNLYDKYDSELDDYDNYDDYDDYDNYDDYDYDYDYDDYDYYENDGSDAAVSPFLSTHQTTTYSITVAAKILIIAASIASIGFWVSNLLAIKDKVKAVKPLKITAIVCVVYDAIFMIVLVLAWPINADQNLLKWIELTGLTASGFFVTALAAWIISRTHKELDLDTMENEPAKTEPVTETTEQDKEVVVEKNENNDKTEENIDITEENIDIEETDKTVHGE